MKGDRHPSRVALREAREKSIERLSEAFAEDTIGLEEFERRLDGAYALERPEDADALVADLAPSRAQGTNTALARKESTPLARMETNANAEAGLALARKPRVRAILGNVERAGRFVVEDGMQVSAILGNVELDLRDVVLRAGRTHLHVRAVFGNVELTVPPELAVECEGSGILGSFSSRHRLPRDEDDERPVLVIEGSAVFGNVEIHTRPRGPKRSP